jgi:hypothetical protein
MCHSTSGAIVRKMLSDNVSKNPTAKTVGLRLGLQEGLTT